MSAINALLQNYDSITRTMLQILLNSLWQGLVIMLLVAALFKLKSSMSATTRHAIWFVSLVTIGVLPFLPFSIRRIAPPNTVTQQIQAQVVVESSVQPAGLIEINPIPSSEVAKRSIARVKETKQSDPLVRGNDLMTVQPISINSSVSAESKSSIASPATNGTWFSRFTARVFAGRLPAVLITLWIAAALFMLTRIISSFILMFRLRMNLNPIPDHNRHQMKRLASTFGLKRHVWIRTSTKATVPMTIRPVQTADRDSCGTDFDIVRH